MQLKTLLDSFGALQELSAIKFPNGAVSFRVGKFLNEAQPLINLALEKQRELFTEHGQDQEAFNQANKLLLDEEVEIKIPDLKLSDFKKGDDWIEFSAGSYSVLSWLINDDC